MVYWKGHGYDRQTDLGSLPSSTRYQEILEHLFLECGHQASRVSIIWKLVIDVNLCPRPSESETLEIENSIHAICASQSSQVILKYNEPGTLCYLLEPWVTYLRNGANNLP